MAEPRPLPQPVDGPSRSEGSDDSSASEFLSESSPDFETLRRSSAARRSEAVLSEVPKRPAGQSPVTLPTRPSVPPAAPAKPPRPVRWGWLVLIVAAVGAGPAYILYQNRPGRVAERAVPAAPREGVATIDSRPSGATVIIDGVTRGVTPLRLSLPAGAYAVELRSGSATKTLSMRVEAGETLRESVELSTSASTGRIEVTSDPPGARVTIDGLAAGITPLTVSDAPPGAHRITVTANGNTVSRAVVVEPGTTVSVLLSPQASALPVASGGWVSIDAPFEMQVLEDGAVIGTSDASRIMLPVGRHELELRASRFGFRTTATVDVVAGRSVVVPVTVPNGRLSVNAAPWAEVWLDGQALGQTPVANVSVPVGTHQIVWRHPQLGERRESVEVGAEAPVRIGIDMATGRLLGQ